MGSPKQDKVTTIYCFCFAVKKFPGLASFLLFPEKLSRLTVTLPILDTLDSNIHGKTFAATKRSTKTAKLFRRKTKAIYSIRTKRAVLPVSSLGHIDWHNSLGRPSLTLEAVCHSILLMMPLRDHIGHEMHAHALTVLEKSRL